MSSLERLGWNPFFEEQVRADDRLRRDGGRLARVVEEQRGLYRLAGEYDGWAEVSGRFRHEAARTADFPAVGDWVAVQDSIIHHRLARRSTISRAAAGRAVDEQVIAANVDTILIVTDAADDLNARRIDRYLTMVWDAGAAPVVVMNKADLSSDPRALVEELRGRLPFVEIVAASALAAGGLEALAPFLQPAHTLALVGSSGVGKSTIVNALVGEERLRVGPIREDDGRGRHTTTARQLIELPGGALLIDTPGMRELQPWADEEAVGSAFDDIEALALDCRFSDCAHGSEPDCAVLAAVAAGTLAADRLESYRRLLREAAFEVRKRDKAAAAEQKRRWRKIHQANKALYRERGR